MAHMLSLQELGDLACYPIDFRFPPVRHIELHVLTDHCPLVHPEQFHRRQRHRAWWPGCVSHRLQNIWRRRNGGPCRLPSLRSDYDDFRRMAPSLHFLTNRNAGDPLQSSRRLGHPPQANERNWVQLLEEWLVKESSNHASDGKKADWGQEAIGW